MKVVKVLRHNGMTLYFLDTADDDFLVVYANYTENFIQNVFLSEETLHLFPQWTW